MNFDEICKERESIQERTGIKKKDDNTRILLSFVTIARGEVDLSPRAHIKRQEHNYSAQRHFLSLASARRKETYAHQPKYRYESTQAIQTLMKACRDTNKQANK